MTLRIAHCPIRIRNMPMHGDTLQSARDAFLASLKPQEREFMNGCTSAEDLIAALNKFQAQQHKSLPLRKVFNKISTFKENISPFINVANTLVSSNPEFAALAWGGTLLILEVCPPASS